MSIDFRTRSIRSNYEQIRAAMITIASQGKVITKGTLKTLGVVCQGSRLKQLRDGLEDEGVIPAIRAERTGLARKGGSAPRKHCKTHFRGVNGAQSDPQPEKVSTVDQDVKTPWLPSWAVPRDKDHPTGWSSTVHVSLDGLVDSARRYRSAWHRRNEFGEQNVYDKRPALNPPNPNWGNDDPLNCAAGSFRPSHPLGQGI